MSARRTGDGQSRSKRTVVDGQSRRVPVRYGSVRQGELPHSDPPIRFEETTTKTKTNGKATRRDLGTKRATGCRVEFGQKVEPQPKTTKTTATPSNGGDTNHSLKTRSI